MTKATKTRILLALTAACTVLPSGVDAAYRTIASELPSSYVIECYDNGYCKTAEQINVEIQSIVQQL